MPTTLTEWLRSLDEERLADVLAARPEVCDLPPPELATLASRLSAPNAVLRTVQRLPAPALEVLQVLMLRGRDGTDRGELAAWLGVAEDDPDLTATLRLLSGLALAWPAGDRLRMVDPLYEIVRYQATIDLGRFPTSLDRFRFPLGLGAPAANLLAQCSTATLRSIARTLHLPVASRKQQLLDSIGDLLRDPERVRALVDSAPPDARQRLLTMAHSGPTQTHHPPWAGPQPIAPELTWASVRGLVLTDAWGVIQPPREVALALRGPDWHAPFHPNRPLPPTVEVAADAVEREAAAAASAAVEALGSLLATVEATPVATLKTGGVGVRELRRLSRVTGLALPVVHLWLEVAYEAGLIAVSSDRAGGGELLPTDDYDDWLGQEPAEQLAAVLPAWLRLPAAPLLPPPDRSTRPPPALVREYGGQLVAVVRRALQDLLTSLPRYQGITTEADLAATVSWQAPLLIDPAEATQLIYAIWAEALLAGVVAHGSLSSLGRALAADDATLLAACRRLLPTPSTEAVFQADLTAMVPGTPQRALAVLLDATADRESRGGAVTWRFNADSVRRGLDIGWQAEDLLAALRERAVGGALPQPLAYLVTDVARRHGAVRVREVGCVLHTEDAALAAELTRVRSLRGLRLATLAPTVLSCAATPEQTLTALRSAGYAPVAEDASGVPQLTTVRRRRAGGGREPRARSEPNPRSPVDLRQFAKELLATPLPADPAAAEPGNGPPATGLVWAGADTGWASGLFDDPDAVELAVAEFAALTRAAPDLDTNELLLLVEAITAQLPVMISYTDRDGERTSRVIEPVEREGAHLIAWCHLREDERRFALRRITSVAPADHD